MQTQIGPFFYIHIFTLYEEAVLTGLWSAAAAVGKLLSQRSLEGDNLHLDCRL